MSMVTADVAQVLQQKQKRKSTPRPYKARMATKVRWALGDVMERSVDAQNRMKRILARVEEAQGLAEDGGQGNLVAVLGRIGNEMAQLALIVAELERIARDAMAEAKPEPKKYSEL